MKNIEEEIYSYKEKVLQMQFDISECINHAPTKGEIREDFIKRTIKDSIDGIQTLKGIIVMGEYQSPQTDLIIPKKNAIINQTETNCIIGAEDVKFVFEIKSKLKLTHIKKIDNTLKTLKNNNPNIKGGIICYKVNCLEKNLLKKFGYFYDEEIDGYQKDTKGIINEFNNIDYIISFDSEKEFILSRDILGDFILNNKVPIIKDFLRIFNNSEVGSRDE